MADLIYYKRNVGYVVGGRFFLGDPNGWTMPNDNPYVAVPADKLREFKLANKRIILEGLIVPSDPPSIDWETENAVTDDEAKELVKNYLQLKQRLQKMDSLSAVIKLLELAKETDRPTKTIKLIEARVAELDEGDEDFGKRGE
jgi:hypothetical protein